MTVRIGIIGAGQAGAHHARAIVGNPRAAVAWIADPIRERGEALAAQCGARYAPHAADTPSNADAVSICVPHARLAETALAAARAGVHILLEKPMATTLADAGRVIEAAELAGVVLMVGFVHRYRPEAQRAKALIAGGAVGEVRLVTDWAVGGGQAAWPAWVQDARSGGGLLLYSGVHRFDRVRWLLNRDVLDVRGSIARLLPGSDVDSSYAALLTLAGDARAALSLHYHTFTVAHAWETTVHGTDGLIRIRTGAGIDIVDRKCLRSEPSGSERHFPAEIDAFLDAIEGRGGTIPTGADGRAALEVALGILQSDATGQTLNLHGGSAT